MAPYSQCVTTALLLSALNLTFLSIPGFDMNLLKFHTYNLSCSNISLGGLGANWEETASYAGITQGGSIHCRANLAANVYQGYVLANVAVQPSELQLVRTVESPHSDVLCLTRSAVTKSCSVKASLVRLYSDPPNSLIDLLLANFRLQVNAFLERYVCEVVLPRIEKDIVNYTYPLTPERKDDKSRKNIPIDVSIPLRGIMSIANKVSIAGNKVSVSSHNQRLSVKISHPGGSHVRYVGGLVPSGPQQSVINWLQGLVDAYLAKRVPHPFPVYGLPQAIDNIEAGLNSSQMLYARFDVDMAIAGSGSNWVSIYRDPGVTVENLQIQWIADGFGSFMTHEFAPIITKVINAKVAAALAAFNESAHHSTADSADADEPIVFTFGRSTAVHDTPMKIPLVVIGSVGFFFGALLVIRNVRKHWVEPVLSTTTGLPVSALRLVAEDCFIILSALCCILLFVASCTMTGASVVIGNEMHAYVFSLSDTVADMWHAGLYVLSVLVLVFSGIYPYVKLLSILGFTVVAHRPRSTALMLIDYVGKLSLIDTFSLIVMVSGLEIRHVADVRVHPGFYFFMYATIGSMALGNYATQLWRRGTTIRSKGIKRAGSSPSSPGENDDARSTLACEREPAEQVQPMIDSINLQDGPSVQRQGRLLGGELRKKVFRCFRILGVIVMIGSTIPAWVLPSLQYDVEGIARLLTPPRKSLSLWTLSSLGGRSNAFDLLVLTLFTVLVSPCLYVILFPRFAFLASWCAADVLVVACVVGLTQLHQFIGFILGEGMEDAYMARASLLWPVWLLGGGSLLIWVYIGFEIRHGAVSRKRSGAIPYGS